MNQDLTLLDRCDGCGAAAKATAHKDKKRLLFCGHHFKKFEQILLNDGWTTVFEGETKMNFKLNPKEIDIEELETVSLKFKSAAETKEKENE